MAITAIRCQPDPLTSHTSGIFEGFYRSKKLTDYYKNARLFDSKDFIDEEENR